MREKLNQVSQNVSSENVSSEMSQNVSSETSQNVSSENVSSENATDQIVTPEEYFEAAYQKADGYLTLCTITQPSSANQRGRLLVKGVYDTNSIPELLSLVNELNGQYHIYTNIHPLREPPQQGRGKESDI